MSQYFPIPYKLFEGDITVKVDLSNYATKSDFNNGTGTNTSKLAAKFYLPTMPHINSGTYPPPPIFNVVCKYQRQFLGTSFGVAILPLCCNIG